jgi:hypothetical protein
VNLSIHPALIAQPSAQDPTASGQTSLVFDGLPVPASALPSWSAKRFRFTQRLLPFS